jgi:chromosome partitioning protein
MTTLAIIAQKGGAGKTTLAIHIAAEAQRAKIEALVIDADPQASASQWSQWRDGAAPEVIDCPPPLLARKIEQAQQIGARFIVIDTPPHADGAATAAAALADLILIPCRPSALDLHAIQLTARLIESARKRAAVVFMGGPPHAPRLHEEAAQIVSGYGLEVCPVRIAERADYRNAVGAGKVAREIAPNGKAAEEMAALWKWIKKEAR